MAPSDRTQFAPNSPAARDIAYYLHPFTNPTVHEENGPFIVNEGKGIYVYDEQGNEYIEGMSGLWCTSSASAKSGLQRSPTNKCSACHTFRGSRTALTRLPST